MMSHSVIESNGITVEVKGRRVWIDGIEVCNGAQQEGLITHSFLLGFALVWRFLILFNQFFN